MKRSLILIAIMLTAASFASAKPLSYNKTLSGRFYGFGRPGSGGTNYDCAYPAKKSALESMSSNSILNNLNACASRLSSFGASEWTMGADGYPCIK